MASTHLERTAGSTGNRRTWTWSSWVRRAAVPGTADAKGGLFATKTDANNRLDFGIDANHKFFFKENLSGSTNICLLYTSPSPRDGLLSRMPSSA